MVEVADMPGDPMLKTFVGIEVVPGVDPNPYSTFDITSQLVSYGCVGTN